jgi:hypothetical protein
VSEPGLGWPVNDPQEPAPSGSATWRSPGYRPGGRRALVLTALLGVYVALSVASIAMDLTGFGLLDKARAGTLGAAEADSFDATRGTIGLATAGVYLLSAIAVLAWLSRTVDNVPPLTGETPERSPRAAIGWWFVPFANWYVPFTIVRDAVRRLRLGTVGDVGVLLVPWWLCYVVGNLVATLSTRVPSDTLEDLRTTFTLSLVSDVLMGVAAIALILIVRGVEAASRARATAHAQPAAVQAPIPTTPDVVTRADPGGPSAPPPPPATPAQTG